MTNLDLFTGEKRVGGPRTGGSVEVSMTNVVLCVCTGQSLKVKEAVRLHCLTPYIVCLFVVIFV